MHAAANSASGAPASSATEDFDVFTALIAGLADQQANDHGGDRWLALTDQVMDMLLDRLHQRQDLNR